MVDPIFAARRLAELYDHLDDDRSDLDVYAAIVGELGARSVVDIGCGTGTFACMLASSGLDVTGVDPAAASLDVARRKPSAERVTWVLGGAADVPPDLGADVATMTGNVAQVFLDDDDWTGALAAARRALRPGGTLVFESRDPAQQAWLEWDREQSWRRVDVPGEGVVETWVELTDVRLPCVSLRWTFVFERDGAVLTSDSTLRFRTADELAASLASAGFVVDDVRDAPDRPGRELVFLARRPDV